MFISADNCTIDYYTLLHSQYCQRAFYKKIINKVADSLLWHLSSNYLIRLYLFIYIHARKIFYTCNLIIIVYFYY